MQAGHGDSGIKTYFGITVFQDGVQYLLELPLLRPDLRILEVDPVELDSAVTHLRPAVVLFGEALPQAAIRRLPHACFGGYLTTDRFEIETLHAIERQMSEFNRPDAKAERPLSLGVFGPPGAGKSFAVKEISKTIFGKEAWLEFNLSQFKDVDDLIGAFHQPKAVIIDPSVLRTLPRRELSAGMYEALKYGVIWDRALFDFIRDKQAEVERFDGETLAHIIRRSCEIKAEVVTTDERESGLRKILNYGHTIGHALEAVTHYRRLKHGEAVGYGMKAAANIANKAGLLAKEERAAIDAGVAALGRLPRISDLQVPDIQAAMSLDKKAAQGKVPLILPTTIGAVVVRDDIAPALVRAGIKELLQA